MFPVISPSQQRPASGGGSPGENASTPPQAARGVREVRESQCYLTSVKSLRAAVVKGKHNREPRSLHLCEEGTDLKCDTLRAHGDPAEAHLRRHRRREQVPLAHPALDQAVPCQPRRRRVRPFLSSHRTRADSDAVAYSEELFYQLALRQFGDMGRLRLNPAPSLRTLVALAVDAEAGVERSKLTRPQIVDVRSPPCAHTIG